MRIKIDFLGDLKADRDSDKIISLFAETLTNSLISRIGEENTQYIGLKVSLLKHPRKAFSLIVELNIEYRPVKPLELEKIVYEAINNTVMEVKRRLEKDGIITRLWRVSEIYFE